VNINLSISDKNNLKIKTNNININEINEEKNPDKNNNLTNNDFVNIDLKEEINEDKNSYPDLETINKNSMNNNNKSNNNNNDNFTFEILGEDEHEKLKILTSNNKNDFSNFDPSDDIVKDDNFLNINNKNEKTDIKGIMKLYNLLLEDDKKKLKGKEYFIITEKIDNKHKIYEISFINSGNAKFIKCYRRFKHFWLLNEKLKKTYPYIIIPRLPRKKKIYNMISSQDKLSDDDRLYQLIFYINFLFLHENLKKTKEFFKFIENATFDISYFTGNQQTIMTSRTHDDLDLSGMNINYLDEITSKNKNYSLSGSLTSLWNFFIPYNSSGNKKREINDSEIIIKKMHIHFNNIINQYTLITENIEKVFKANEDESNANKKISDVFLYLKDSFIHLNNYDKVMLNYYEQTKILSERQIESVKKASKLKHKLSALINLLYGICFTLEKYLNFINKYNELSENMNKAKAIKNKGKNMDELIKEYQIYERVKNKFELQLSKETNIYCQIYDETTYYCLLKFREVLESSTIVKIKNKDKNKDEIEIKDDNKNKDEENNINDEK